MDKAQPHYISVFPYSLSKDGKGGNPATIFLNADDLTPEEMRQLATKAGHECGFVLSNAKTEHPDCHLVMKYWVPNHEMEMCGHATVGAVWVMDQLGLLPAVDRIRISTLSGIVDAQIVKNGSDTSVLVSQPTGTVENIPDDLAAQVLSCLGISSSELAPARTVQNGKTSRTKTLIPIKDQSVLDRLSPDPAAVQSICEKIGSTGLYPYAVLDQDAQLVEARQFPRSSGYDEDPATGIAAAALTYGLISSGVISAGTVQPVVVRQGWSMGQPSEIFVSLRHDEGAEGCWISGKVVWSASHA
ncbi:hypothetical protein VHEMI04532 [[Torrubiella] hemipterigena]|uniref:Uncharacterized protein n=1 Tax=[Torrubiella] hemipterigena TaxID=1531966 RepID=A0A0A1TEM3_9HYPO|nr:hypothetical protein VHEMI04532 [[Torrubiella] hemipterigena]